VHLANRPDSTRPSLLRRCVLECCTTPGSNDYNEAIEIARERYLSGARSMRGTPSLAEQATSSGSHILIETHREQDPKETSI
jgi:hypothetical protein